MHRNINYTKRKAYSEYLSKIRPRKISLNCVIILFSSSCTTRIKQNLSWKQKLKHKTDHGGSVCWRFERSAFVWSEYKLLNYARGANHTKNLSRAIVCQNKFDHCWPDLNELCSSEMNLNCSVAHFSTRGAIRKKKNLHDEMFIQI